MARAAVMVGVACAVAFVVWLVWPRGASGPAFAPEPAAAASALPSPAPAARVADAAQVERTSAPAPESPRETLPLPADAQWVDVLVVDKATQQPVADADAWWTDETHWPIQQAMPAAERYDAYRERDRVAERIGWHARSDKDGVLRITLGENTTLFARAGTRWGEAWFGRERALPPEGRRVLLENDVTLRVHVVDHAGRPAAGVPIGLDDVEAGVTSTPVVGAECPTDRDGIASLRHLQSRQAHQWGPKTGQLVPQWSVRVAIPGLAVAPVLVDAQQPPADPVEVQLPPTGSLRARIVLDGVVPPSLDRVNVHAGPKGTDVGHNSAWSRMVEADGFAHFPFLPLGKTLYLGAPEPGGQWDLEVPGPTRPEQVVTATFDLKGEVVAITGRMVAADGQPVANETLIANFNAGMMSGGAQVRTDAAGRFVWILGRPQVTPKLSQLAFDRPRVGPPTQRATVPPRDLAIGRNDLGDVSFAVGALVVAGTFVFDTPGPATPGFVIQRFVGDAWRQVSDLQTDVQANGAFEVRGTVEPGRYRIELPPSWGVGHLAVDPVEFAPGARNLEIKVRRGEHFTVKCRLPEGLDPSAIALRLLPASVAPARATPPVAPRHADSSVGQNSGLAWNWLAVEPGAYTLRVEAFAFAEPLATVADVVVPAPAGGDPRLADLDLRDAIGTLKVRVKLAEDDGGRDKGRGREMVAFPQPQAPDQEWRGFAVTTSERVYAVPKRPVDLLFVARGMRPASVRGAVGALEVAFESWLRIEVRFAGLDELPAGSVVRAIAGPAAPAAGGARRFVTEWQSGDLDSLLRAAEASVPVVDGAAVLAIGDEPVSLSLSLQLDARGRRRLLKQLAPNVIAAGAPVAVQVSADELRGAIAELRAEADKAAKAK